MHYITKNALRIWGTLGLLWCKFACIKKKEFEGPWTSSFRILNQRSGCNRNSRNSGRSRSRSRTRRRSSISARTSSWGSCAFGELGYRLGIAKVSLKSMRFCCRIRRVHYNLLVKLFLFVPSFSFHFPFMFLSFSFPFPFIFLSFSFHFPFLFLSFSFPFPFLFLSFSFPFSFLFLSCPFCYGFLSVSISFSLFLPFAFPFSFLCSFPCPCLSFPFSFVFLSVSFSCPFPFLFLSLSFSFPSFLFPSFAFLFLSFSFNPEPKSIIDASIWRNQYSWNLNIIVTYWIQKGVSLFGKVPSLTSFFAFLKTNVQPIHIYIFIY